LTGYVWDASGWAAAAFAIYAFNAKTMIPLRIAATVATVFGFTYATSKGAYPNMAVNAVLFGLNVERLRQMRQLVVDSAAAVARPEGYEWLKPFMHRVDFPEGHVLFRRGDVGSQAYLLGSGDIFIVEHDAYAKAGDLIGEIGLWTVGHRRTATAICRSRVRAWRVSYSELEQLCLQNPQFCLSLARIIVQRYETNISAPPT
jgi:CRP/FNR family transcriptional regulator, cyclic AMP receptor protein